VAHGVEGCDEIDEDEHHFRSVVSTCDTTPWVNAPGPVRFMTVIPTQPDSCGGTLGRKTGHSSKFPGRSIKAGWGAQEAGGWCEAEVRPSRESNVGGERRCVLGNAFPEMIMDQCRLEILQTAFELWAKLFEKENKAILRRLVAVDIAKAASMLKSTLSKFK